MGTWFYCDKSAKKRIDEEIEKQVRPAREMYERLCDQKKMAEKNREEKEKLFETFKEEVKNNNYGEGVTKDYTDKAKMITGKELVEMLTNTAEKLTKKEEDPKHDPNFYRQTGDIYMIDQSEYGDDETYNWVSLNYYNDGVLTEDLDDVVEDVDLVIGNDIYEQLADLTEKEVYTVYVRNDVRKCDYEILLQETNFEG